MWYVAALRLTVPTERAKVRVQRQRVWGIWDVRSSGLHDAQHLRSSLLGGCCVTEETLSHVFTDRVKLTVQTRARCCATAAAY